MLDEGCPSGRTGTLHAIAVSSGQRIFIWSLQQKLNDSALATELAADNG